jgi:hypothetical protein
MFIENIAESTAVVSNNRLVVLVPDDLQNLSSFAQEIHWLAQKLGREVLFLSLDSSSENQLAASRLLATLESVTQDASLKVDSALVKAHSWIDAIGLVTHLDDLIVCHEQQVAKLSPFHSLPLSNFLANDRKLQVHVLTGSYYTEATRLRSWAMSLFFWFGFLTLIAGFSFLEIQAQTMLSGAPEKIIFLALFLIEFGLIYCWTKITN